MKRIKKYIYILICTFCMLISMTPASAASVTGDQSLDPIIMKQKDSVKTAMSKNCGTKYFRVVINEPGILTVKLNSTKLKKNAEIRILHDETGIDYDSQIIKYNKKKKKLSGKMVSSSILMPGQYDIVIKTTDVSKKLHSH